MARSASVPRARCEMERRSPRRAPLYSLSEALYLRDPDENGVELYWDRPKESWPRTPEGKLAMFSRPLDLDDLLRG